MTHKVCNVGVRCKQYIGKEFLCNSFTPTLPTPPSPYPTESCLFNPYPKKPMSRNIADLNILFFISNILASPQFVHINNTDATLVIVYFCPQREYKMCVNIGPSAVLLNVYSTTPGCSRRGEVGTPPQFSILVLLTPGFYLL